MATDTYEAPPAPVEPKKGGGCLKGCLIVLLLLFVLAVIGAVLVWIYGRQMASSMASQGINTIIDEADLPAAEKAELKAEAKRITDGIADGSISMPEIEKLMTGIANSPLVPLIMVKSAEAQYLNNSGLSDEEKADGRLALERYGRGLIDKKMTPEANDRLMSHIADKDEQGQWKLRKQVSDDELRAFLAAAKEEADAAGVPEEVEPIDPSDELKKVIDAAIGPADAAEPPAE